MTEHTPTPWQANAENWLSVDDGSDIWHKSLICQVNGKERPEAEANKERVIACVNAFHDPAGRTIATEDIREGLVWLLVDELERRQEYFNQRADAEYLPHHPAPSGNEEMRLFMETRELLASLKVQGPET